MTNPPPHTSVETWERGQRRREEIIEVASGLFAENGYRGTGLAAIAAAVGVTQPTVLHHFGSKEGLLRAVVARLEASGAGFGDRPAVDDAPSIADFVAGLAMQMQVVRDRAHLRLVLAAENLMPDELEHESFVALYGDIRRRLVERLLAAQRDGTLRADVDVDVAATEIVAVVDGLQQQWIRQPQALDLGRALEEFAALLELQLYA